MKKLVIASLALAFASTLAFGQGQISFLSRGGGVDAPVTNIVTGQRVSGTGYLAQLYYGPAGASESSLVTFGGTTAANFATATLAGYVITSTGGGVRTVDLSIPGVVAGQPTSFQLRAWEASLGATWELAFPAWQSGAAGPVLGKSAIISTKTSATIAETAQPLLGLQGFNLTPVPEPSVIALGALGLAALLYRRRK